VYITIPGGDYTSNDKIILGKYSNKSNDPITYEDPLDRLFTNMTITYTPEETDPFKLVSTLSTFGFITKSFAID
jgi:hypothetical protein